MSKKNLNQSENVNLLNAEKAAEEVVTTATEAANVASEEVPAPAEDVATEVATPSEDTHTTAESETKPKTRLAQAQDEWADIYSHPILVLKLWQDEWKKGETSNAKTLLGYLKEVGVKTTKDIVPNLVFGRFYMDGQICRKARKGDAERHPERMVQGFDRNGEPCMYIQVPRNPKAYLSALNAICKDAEILAAVKAENAARKAAKAATEKAKKMASKATKKA